MDINNHIFKGEVLVPIYWEKHITDMIDNFDKELRIKWLPEPLSNFIVKHRIKNKIKQIKINFGTLRVKGDFTDNLQKHIISAKDKCNNTCQFCGSMKEVDTIVVKGWVYRSCKECQ